GGVLAEVQAAECPAQAVVAGGLRNQGRGPLALLHQVGAEDGPHVAGAGGGDELHRPGEPVGGGPDEGLVAARGGPLPPGVRRRRPLPQGVPTVCAQAGEATRSHVPPSPGPPVIIRDHGREGYSRSVSRLVSWYGFTGRG